MDGSTQKKQVAAPQQINPEVMDVIKRKGAPKQDPQVEKAKLAIKTIAKKYNMSLEDMVQGGNMCDMALADQSLYPMVKDYVVKKGWMAPQDLKNEYDVKLLVFGSTLGKLAQMIIDEGGM